MVTIGKVSPYCSMGCMDPNTFTSKLCTTTRIEGRMCSFCECEPTEGWVVEVGLSNWFPANFTQVEDEGRGMMSQTTPPWAAFRRAVLILWGQRWNWWGCGNYDRDWLRVEVRQQGGLGKKVIQVLFKFGVNG